LRFGEDEPILGGLGFESLKMLFEGFQIAPLPDGTDTARGNEDGFLFKFVGDAELAESGLFDGEFEDGFLDVLLYAIFDYRLPAADFLKSLFAAGIVKLFEAVEAVSGVPHDFAGLGNVPQLPRQFKQSDFGFDDFLFRVHLTILSCKEDAQVAVRLRQASAGLQPIFLID
jgi:hypothetical protein